MKSSFDTLLKGLDRKIAGSDTPRQGLRPVPASRPVPAGRPMVFALAGCFVLDRRPLYQRVAMAAGVLCLLVALAISACAAWITWAETARQADATLSRVAAEFAHRLDVDLDKRAHEIETIASLGPLRQVWASDPATLREMLEQMRAFVSHYRWIGFVGQDGVVRAATGGTLERQRLTDRAWYRNGRYGPTLAAIGDGKQAPTLEITFPVHDARGALLGVLAADLAATWADDARKRFRTMLEMQPGDPLRDVDFVVLSAEGDVVLGPTAGFTGLDPSDLDEAALRRLARAGDTVATRDAAGVPHRAAVARTRGAAGLPGSGWLVVAHAPTSAAYAAARARVVEIALTGAAAAALGILVSLALALRIARPYRALCAEAEAGLDHADRAAGSDEVSRLAHAVRTLIRRRDAAERQMFAATEHADRLSAHVTEEIAGLRRLVDSDPMTGALNRRGLLTAVENARAGVPCRSLGVLVIDIDHFKRVNDTYGHAAGDKAIRKVADTIRATVRQHDIVARFGGEEFVVVVTNTTTGELATLAERIREAVQAVPGAEGLPIRVTVSIGGAVADVDAADIEELIDQADTGLYEAKESGRNRVRMVRPSAASLRLLSDQARAADAAALAA